MFSVEGSRVRIRTLSTADLKDFAAYRSMPASYRWQAFGAMDETEARQFLRKHQSLDIHQAGQWQQLGIELMETGQLIGDLAIRFSRQEARHAELGLTISPDFQHLGIGKETLTVLLRFLFTTGNMHKVYALIDEHNYASIKLIESKGFVCEGRLRKHFWNSMEQRWDDEFFYGLLIEEWQQQQDTASS